MLHRIYAYLDTGKISMLHRIYAFLDTGKIPTKHKAGLRCYKTVLYRLNSSLCFMDVQADLHVRARVGMLEHET